MPGSSWRYFFRLFTNPKDRHFNPKNNSEIFRKIFPNPFPVFAFYD